VELVEGVLEFLANNIFGEVAILIGIITLVGLILQRTPVEETVAGTLRAVIGVLILFIGVDVFTEGLSSFQAIVSSAVGLEPPQADNTLGDFLGTHGGSVALVIALGFLVHLILVRLFNTRYVYLTGHLLFWIAVVTVASIVEIFGDLGQWTIVGAASLVVAAYWTLQPLVLAPMMRKVTGSDDFGFAHTSALAAYLGGKIGGKAGSYEQHDTEGVRLPQRLSFFKDVNVSTALVIGVIILVAMVFAEVDVAQEQAAAYDEDLNRWVWGLIAGLRFAAGIAILLYGVRMFLAEIVPAFKGISEKVIPGSRPALDAPAVFPFAPTAVMLGFISATAVFLVLMGVFAAIGWFVLVPPMIMLFFPGAAAGVFGNAFGGWRGAVIGGGINGLFLAFGQAISWGYLSDTAPELATLADPDWYLIMVLVMGIGALGALLGEMGVWLVPVVLLVVFVVWTMMAKRVGAEPEAEPLSGDSPFDAPDVSRAVRRDGHGDGAQDDDQGDERSER